MKDNISSASVCLHRLIHEIMTHIGFSSNIGLLDGKMGICILLYHYAHYLDAPEIEEYAGWLLDEIYEETDTLTTLNFSFGLCGIAWGIHYLSEKRFIDAEDLDEVLEEIDNTLWNKSFECAVTDKDIFETGRYLQVKIKTTQRREIWKGRAIAWLDRLCRLFDERQLLSPYECKKLQPVLSFCHYWQSMEDMRPSIEKLYKQLPLILKFSYLNERNRTTQQSMIQQLAINPFLSHAAEFIAVPGIIWGQEYTLQEINTYFLDRLLNGISLNTASKQYEDGISRILSDKKWINETISLINPQNVGLQGNAAGFAWALLCRLLQTKSVKMMMFD